MNNAKYLGMNRGSGRTVTDLEHIRQSVSDILITPIGSRTMRRSYGSLLSNCWINRKTTCCGYRLWPLVTAHCCSGNHAFN